MRTHPPLNSFLRLIARFRVQLAWLCLLETGAALFALAAPYFSKLFIDQAFLGKNMAKFVSISSWGALTFAFTLVMYVLSSRLKQRLRISLPLALKQLFLRRFFRLGLPQLQNQPAGERVQRFLEVEPLAGFIIEEFPGLVSSTVVFIGSLAAAFWIEPRMTVLTAVLSPLFLLRSAFFQKKMSRIYEDIWGANAGIAARAHESFDKIFFVKAYAMEHFHRHRIVAAVIVFLRRQKQMFRWELFSYLSVAFLAKAVYGAVMLYGGWLIITGRTTLGNYSAVMLYLVGIGTYAENLGSKIESTAGYRITLGHFLEICESPAEESAETGTGARRLTRGAISFSGLGFAYPTRPALFSGLDLQLPAGSWLGIAGASGSGKTTLVSLLLRLYGQWDGRISIDGIDLRRYPLRHLRRAVCFVSQQPFLFDGTIAENLVGDLKGVGADRLEEVCRLACIHEEIIRLPEGYRTLIGEDAYRLSQGQKQRLCIARALLRDPVILILDEATASLHPAMEMMFFRSLRQARRNRTTLVVSHRCAPLQYSDAVLFLGGQEGVMTGAHQALLENRPAYRAFFEQQEIR